MAVRDEPPDLRERIGVATNDDGADPLGKIGALGAATLMLPHKPLSEPAPTRWNPDRRLAALLWRLKFGLDARSAGPEAVALFAWWLRRHPIFARFNSTPESQTLRMFAARVICEWVHDRCEPCGGTGLANPEPTATVAKNVHRIKRCEVCQQHPGRPVIDHAARALALGLPQPIYWKYWERRFAKALELMPRIEPRCEEPLRKQMRRSNIAPQ